MGGMSEVQTSIDPFGDMPEQGCFTVAATIVFMVIMLRMIAVVELYHRFDKSCGARAARPQNFVAIVISQHNDAVRSELASLCEGHVTGPIITVEGGKFDTWV